MTSIRTVLRHHVLFALCFLALNYSTLGFQASLRSSGYKHVIKQRSLVVRPQTVSVLWSTVPSSPANEYNNADNDQTSNISNTFQTTNTTLPGTSLGANKSLNRNFKNRGDTFFSYLLSRLILIKKLRATIFNVVTGKSGGNSVNNSTNTKRLWNRRTGSNNTPSNQQNNHNKNKSPLGKFVSILRYFFMTKAGLLRLGSFVIATLIYQKFIFKPSSLLTEISFANFLKLLNESPEVISRVRASPSMLSFVIDGKSFFTRVVNLPIPILDKLIASGVNFHAPAPPKNIFGMLSSVLYLGFMWRLVNRMMQGPADEGVGKGRGDLDLER